MPKISGKLGFFSNLGFKLNLPEGGPVGGGTTVGNVGTFVEGVSVAGGSTGVVGMSVCGGSAVGGRVGISV